MNKLKTVLALFDPRNNKREAMTACSLALAVTILSFAGHAVAQSTSNVSLTVTVNTALTFTTLTDNFTTINPGTPQFATTTLSVATNDTAGWNVTLYGSNKGTATNNLQSGANSITDQTEWVNNAATTSAGNALRIASFANFGDVLAFRVMSASSTNGVPFLAPSWWGTTDAYSDNANSLWAGISSSTVQRRIGNASAGSYSASAHINSVIYYLDVASTQPTGAYTAPIVYTATGN